MAALATVADLGDRLGLDVGGEIRAWRLLDDVSASIRSYTGRTFEATTDTIAVPVACGTAQLPNGPVISVSSVEQYGEPVPWTRRGRSLAVAGLAPVTVTYTWGWEEVPPEIVAVACQVAGRAWGVAPQDSGTTQESLGGWAQTTGSAAASGAVGFLPDERAILDRYRLGRAIGTITTRSWAPTGW